MNILFVKYLPSGDASNTLRLFNHFKSKINKRHKITELDLIKNPPKFFDEPTMSAYLKRNYAGESLNGAALDTLKPLDDLTSQFLSADLVVLVTPMNNFSLPGITKVYFDAIMQKEKVFKYVEGKQLGLLDNKKFLTLYTSGGSYQDEFGFLDNLKTLVKIELDFMGIQEQAFIHASTGNEVTRKINIDKAFTAIDALVKKWNL